MTMIRKELLALRKEAGEMWLLVYRQMQQAGEALLIRDKKLASSVVCRERKVNASELKIDSECEDIIARYAPVAIDLRFVLAIFKINTSLERMGDYAESIAKSVLTLPEERFIDHVIIEKTQLAEMLKQVLAMLSLAKDALEKEDSKMAHHVIAMDTRINQINQDATEVISSYLEQHPENAFDCLTLIGIIRKLERFGDHCTNIAEEVIFYLDAKVVKHKEKIYISADE